MKVEEQDSDVYFFDPSKGPPDWREDLSLQSEVDPDDEELSSTPPDVVAILGFDPAK